MIIALTNLEGRTQNTDTICFPVEVAKKVLVAASQKKVLDAQVVILNERITGFEFAISQFHVKDSIRVDGHKKEMDLKDQQNKILLDNIASLNKQVKREKTKRIFTGIGGVLATGIASYLLLKK